MDIDFLGRIDNNLDAIVAAMKDACGMAVVVDGMSFNAETVTATKIIEDVEYEGVRVRLQGSLGNARISLQVDIGFGDVIVPGPSKITYPVLLDFPPPKLNGYSMESTIAEKFQAMVKLGILNSRMRVFDPSFAKDGDKKIQWQGFIRKAKLTDAPGTFEDVIADVKIFLEPLEAALVERRVFCSIWKAPGPWR
jgi:hypothetical protein